MGERARARRDVETVIVGAGMSGLLLAIRLQQRGRRDVAILEARGGVGGTWRANAYPGCCCDVRSFAYLPLHLMPEYIPERIYSTQQEIEAFLDRLAHKHGVHDNVVFNARVTRCERNEAENAWEVESTQGRLRCKYLVFANGPLSRPQRPDIPGLEDVFEGRVWHTAEWDNKVSLKGKRVAVIGTGASAIQIIPQVAKDAQHLYVIQRSAAFCFPRDDGPLTDLPQVVQGLKQQGLSFISKMRSDFNEYADNFVFNIYNNKELNDQAVAHHRKRIFEIVDDPEVAANLVPDYPQGCKRSLLTDDYLPTFNRPNVTLIPAPATRVTPRGVVAENDKREFQIDALDVVVLATGFRTGAIDDVEIVGAEGQTLSQSYEETGVHTMFGLMSHGFDNMFFMLGPQSWTPQGNTCEACDVQSEWIAHVIGAMEDSSVDSISPRPECEQYWGDRCLELGQASVWAQCTSWYLDPKTGRPFMWTGRWQEYVNELLELTHKVFRLRKDGREEDGKEYHQERLAEEAKDQRGVAGDLERVLERTSRLDHDMKDQKRCEKLLASVDDKVEDKRGTGAWCIVAAAFVGFGPEKVLRLERAEQDLARSGEPDGNHDFFPRDAGQSRRAQSRQHDNAQDCEES
ncbi:Baeyer-Villiger monooxygenase (BVMO) [Durusdinium trenchii]|uniref:Baeyer-Villiger monooxygenase (BVMO) n=1 Tax=Durusdinium trenchii TaxID=1381693 RepID=A0ABP0S299_9DINO